MTRREALMLAAAVTVELGVTSSRGHRAPKANRSINEAPSGARMAGTPTGAVADACFVLDTADHKIWIRDSGTWRGVANA